MISGTVAPMEHSWHKRGLGVAQAAAGPWGRSGAFDIMKRVFSRVAASRAACLQLGGPTREKALFIIRPGRGWRGPAAGWRAPREPRGD